MTSSKKTMTGRVESHGSASSTEGGSGIGFRSPASSVDSTMESPRVSSLPYVKDIEVRYLDSRRDNAASDVCELDGHSNDINDGCKGKYVYLREILTDDAAEAMTGLDFHVGTTRASPFGRNLARDAAGDQRQLAPVRMEGKLPVRRGTVHLWRTNDAEAQREQMEKRGFTVLTPDLNKGRASSNYLTGLFIVVDRRV